LGGTLAQLPGMSYKLLLAAMAGASLTASLSASHSASPPAYFIAEVEVKDLAQMNRYGSHVPETLAPFAGHWRYLIRDGHPQSLEGAPPKGTVVIAFDSIEVARAWYDSPAYQAIKPIRDSAAVSRVYLAKGVPVP
jgi:uncharacterized protein (DUF1330 family)